MTETTLANTADSTADTTEVAEGVATTNQGTPALRDPTASSEQAVGEQSDDLGATENTETQEPTSWEGFELSGPEGHDKESVSVFGEALKDAGVTPENAQKALDKIVPVIQERQLAEVNKIHEQWIAESKADELIGGDKFDENMANISKAAQAFGDEGLQELLKPISEGGQGLGNHPAINRLLLRVAQAIVPESKLAKGQEVPAELSEDEVLYDTTIRQQKEGRIR